MRAPSDPKIDKSNEEKWFIHWNHDVPHILWDRYPRKRIRIKVYENLNRYKGKEREEYAQHLVAKYKLLLNNLNYNPFEEELALVSNVVINETVTIEEKILKKEKQISENQKSNTNIVTALADYLQSRIDRTDNTNSHSTHRGVIKWFTRYLTDKDLLELSVSDITRQQIADALLYAKKNNSWNPTTYNSNIDLIMTAFNWFEMEEYILKNPAKGKIQKVKATVGKHTWYKRDIAEKIKMFMVNHEQRMVYNACAFTYHLCVRSQQELLKLKVEDIDFKLKRIRFRKEVSKNGMEAYRDFSPEFEQIALSMKLHKKPQHFYIFGSGGEPSEKMAGKNSLSMPYKRVKDNPKVKLNDDYTIYVGISAIV
ncbi:phage integrase SAM-like domain-containing protein, partial [Pedobacter sp. KBW01]|uniref:phage integrase SAM-like domain-containing protein n=1 Tax=Pedobacter sp. KBW01 TaxID=2153364 RepID=UPI0011CED684